MSREMTKQKKEPLFQMVKRDYIAPSKALLIRFAAVALALVVCALVIIAITKQNPVEVYGGIISGAVGTKRRAWVTVRETVLLLLIAVGLTPAFKMKFWNIGAEGQILIGGTCSAAIMIYLGDKLPNALLLVMIFIVSILAGMVWSLLPAVFKAKYNTNETLFTLMLNYVAMQIVTFCIVFWENPSGSNTVGVINSKSKGGWFPSIGGSQYVLNVIIVLVVTILISVYMNYSKQGYEISVVGESENTAKYVGIKVGKVIIRTMMLSGAICGLVGLLLVGSINHTVTTTIAGGQGFTAVLVSWMSKFNPLTMVLSSFLIIFMDRGASEISTAFGLNHSYSDILTGIILFFIIGCEFFISYKLQFRKKTEKEEQ